MKVASLVDLARQYIRELIITGEFKPGQQLKEEELCKRFGISRPPIREAFKTLEADGLVSRKPRCGVFVTQITAKDVWEIYTIVASLYQMGTSLALKVMTDQDMEKLEALIDQMNSCAEASPPNVRQYQAAHKSFHETIINLTNNERLKKMVKSLQFQLSLISYKSLQNPEHLKSSVIYHRRIMQALKGHNQSLAFQLMKEHVIEALDFLLKVISDESESTQGVHIKEYLSTEK